MLLPGTVHISIPEFFKEYWNNWAYFIKRSIPNWRDRRRVVSSKTLLLFRGCYRGFPAPASQDSKVQKHLESLALPATCSGKCRELPGKGRRGRDRLTHCIAQWVEAQAPGLRAPRKIISKCLDIFNMRRALTDGNRDVFGGCNSKALSMREKCQLEKPGF